MTEHGGVQVDYHLVALARCAGMERVVPGGLREQGAHVGLLLRPGRRFRVGRRDLAPRRPLARHLSRAAGG
jgi:hypothetical protein